MQIFIKKIAIPLASLLTLIAFAEPQVKHLCSFKNYTSKSLEGVSSVIIVFEEENVKSLRSKVKSQITNLKHLFPDTPMKRIAQSSELSSAARNLQNMYIADVSEDENINEVIDELNAMPEVKYAEPNFPVKPLALPNDPWFNDQWGLRNVQQYYLAVIDGVQTNTRGYYGEDIDWDAAWENPAFPTNEVIVAVIDSGVDYTHPDITNQMWVNNNEIPDNGIDDDLNGYIDDYRGYDFFYMDCEPDDNYGHGTHVAGTIAAETDNNIGVAGVCPSAKIMALKFMNKDGAGYISDSALALKYAADNGAKIINNSWGLNIMIQSLGDAIEYAAEKGCVIISAAGNDDTTQKLYPAGYADSFAVAATTSKDKKADFSNYGDWIDFCAPGKDILSLRAKNTDMYSDDAPLVHIVDTNLYLANGTSMASPHAAGAAAILASKNPGHPGWVYGKIIAATSDNIDHRNPTYIDKLGSGRININSMLNYDEPAMFVKAKLPLFSDFSMEFIGAGTTTNLSITISSWTYSLSNVTVVVSNLTDGISLSATSVFIGNIAANFSTNLPEGTVLLSTGMSKKTRNEEVLVQVFADGILKDETTVSFIVYNGFPSSVTVADWNNDGKKEFITTSGGTIYVYDNRGFLKWVFNSPAPSMTFNEVAVGDVDGDGFNELVAAHDVSLLGGQIGLYVFEHDGTIKTGWPVTGTSGFKIPTLVDVDEDGILDIVVPCQANLEQWDSPELRAYKSDTSLIWTRKGNDYGDNKYHYVYRASAGDLDNDGWPELVNIWKTKNYPDKIYVTTHEGKDFGTTIMASYGYYLGDPPALGDIDGDGDMEIIVLGYKLGGVDNRVFAYHHDGTEVAGWPQDAGDKWVVRHTTPRLVDVDGDGDMEVFLGAYKVGLFGWQGDGTPFTNFPIADASCYSQVCIEDIDDDGEAEFVYSIGKQTNTIIRARNLDGSIVPGFDGLQITNTGEVLDMVIEPIPGYSNQIISVIGGGKIMVNTELYIIDTGFASNQLESAWPMHPHDARKTRSSFYKTNEQFVASFSTPYTEAVNHLDAAFTTYVGEPHSSNIFYQWDFNGDGIIDAEGENLSATNITYGIGTHTVSLTVSNGLGGVYTRTRENYLNVYPPVESDFSANIRTANAPFRVEFTDLSTNYPQFWMWDFDGDGTIDSTLQNPSFVYSSTGIFNVSLTVSNNFGDGGASFSTETKIGYIVVPNVVDSSIHYVSKSGSHLFPFKSWEEAANDIQSAINSASAGETVLVTNGTYTSSISLIATNIILKSVNGAEKTIIQGTRSHRCIKLLGPAALLDGFTVQRGANELGSGVNLGGGASAKNCVIYDNNSGSKSGGGLYLYYSPGSVVDNCIIISNSGIHGAAIYASADSPNSVIKDTIIKFNSSQTGGKCIYVFTTKLKNCLIAYNNSGGDLIGLTEGAIMENCTVSKNTFPSSYQTIEMNFSARIYNSIFFGNSSMTFDNKAEEKFYKYSCFDNLPAPAYDGGGNIALNPLFNSSETGDFSLKALSQCINAGDNYLVTTTNDIYGHARIIGGTVDMGCIENNVSFSLDPPEIISPTNVFSGESVFLSFNPESDDIIIEGNKAANSYVYTDNNYGWSDYEILQIPSAGSWSNILEDVVETTYVLKYKSMSSNFTNASPDYTELTIEVIPEPGAIILFVLLMMFGVRRE